MFRHSRPRFSLFAVLLFTSFGGLSPAAGQRKVGRVTAIDGAWRLEYRSRIIDLHQNDSVPALGLVHPPPNPASANLIDITLRNGERKSRICAHRGDCESSFALPDLPPERSAFANVLGAVLEWWRGKPRARVPMIASADEQAPAVIRLQQGRADLAPALKGLPPGRFVLSLIPVQRRAQSPAPVVLAGFVGGSPRVEGAQLGELQPLVSTLVADRSPVVPTVAPTAATIVDWPPTGTVPLQISGLRPGLYHLIVSGPRQRATTVVIKQ